MSTAPRERQGTITAASLLLLVFGTLGVLSGLGIVFTKQANMFPEEAEILARWSAFYLVANAIQVLAGYLLWHTMRLGGVLALAGIVASLLALSFPAPGVYGSTYIIATGATMLYSLATIILLGLGWTALK